MKKSNILLCNELWCDADPNKNRTNSEHNLVKTFDATQTSYHLHTLHLDEAAVVYKTHIDNVLIDYCKNYNIKIVVFSLVGDSPFNPSPSTYQKLKELNIKTCFMWPDATFDINKVDQWADLHVLWDRSNLVGENPKILPLFVPQDRAQFYPDIFQDIPVSFVGSLDKYPDRQYFIESLRQSTPNLVVSGGQRENALSPAEYSSIIRRSKIGLNFSLSRAGFFQVKGRVYEILACNSLLMELKNPQTAKILRPNIDYIEFSNPKELTEAVTYFLANENERTKIASQGYQKYNLYFTAKIFWDTIMNKLNESRT